MSKAERTRQFIIEKASAILNKKGMAGTSISDIMEATKMAKGGIYGNFENKEEICRESFDFLNQNLIRQIDTALKNKPSFKEKLFSLLDFYPQNALKGSSGGCPLLNFGTEADDTNPEIKKRVALAIKASQLRIKTLVAEGIAAGEFKPAVDADEFSVKMFSLIEGAILIGRILGSAEQMIMVTNMLKSEIELFTI